MAQTIRDVMTHDPVTVQDTATITEAAAAMKANDVGDVLVMQDGSLAGVVTDRDIVVRAIADGRDPQSTPVREVCSRDLVTITPDASVDDAVQLMRERAIRRLVVSDGSRPEGVVSIGDLAIERDSRSALADISAATPNS
jgi:CBS domain-containing protein